MLEVNDEESLKKENISIEDSKKEFNDIITKSLELKEKIEGQITEINNLYEKINSEVTKSFEIKHEKLTKEENDMKDILQTEVTKVKEKLENYSSELKNILKLNERINKGIIILEKEEKNMLKILSYVSKMSKYQKDSKKLLSELMRNLKISYK